jgi:branched-chain amino acid transport system permease protein
VVAAEQGISLGHLPTALLALPAGIVVAIILVLVTDRAVYRFHRAKRSSPVIFLIASLGVMFFYNGIVRFMIGPDDRVFTDGERFLITARPSVNGDRPATGHGRAHDPGHYRRW